MPDTLLYTSPDLYSVIADNAEARTMDWDRRLTVLEGRWASTDAAVAAFDRRPWLGFWPESVKAAKTWGGMVRVEIESAGLIGEKEKFYEVTEDNGELQTYQLTGDGAGVSINASGWNPSVLYRAVNVEVGVPKYSIIGFSKFRPDPGRNGHAVSTPFRGHFPTINPPPWRYVGNDAGHTANFPGGWRQVGSPSKLLGGFAPGSLNPAFQPALYQSTWLYAHIEKQTI